MSALGGIWYIVGSTVNVGFGKFLLCIRGQYYNQLCKQKKMIKGFENHFQNKEKYKVSNL